MAKKVGLLTAGSDSPGANAAIRGLGKAVTGNFGMALIGFRDGFAGLVEDRTTDLMSDGALSGLLTSGGTILGTSMDLPHAWPTPGEKVDMVQKAVETYHRHKLDVLVCIGDRRSQEAALVLSRAGLNIITIPRSAENDIPHTDKSIGYDTAREVASQAIDRLHTTANATHRIMIVELLGNTSGWLALGAGLAAGADVILIPEIPYDFDVIIDAIRSRKLSGRNFSLVVVAEKARSRELVNFMETAASRRAGTEREKEKAFEEIEKNYSSQTLLLERRLKESTEIDTHITILGSLVRGGTATAADRILATQLSEWAAKMIAEGEFGKMACRIDGAGSSVPLEEVAGRSKVIPMSHDWIRGAAQVGVCLGVEYGKLRKGGG